MANTHSLLFASASSQQVTVANSANYQFAGAFSIAFFIKTTATASQNILGLLGSGGQWDFVININGFALNKVTLDIRQVGVADHTHASTDIINDGHWHYVVCGRDGSGNTFMYVDKKSQSGSIVVANAITATGQLTFGAFNAANYFDGDFNGIALYNIAVTSSQADDRATDKTSDTGLVGYWKLNDGTGTTAVDSKNANNGTLVNTPSWVTDVPFGTYWSIANSLEVGSTRFNTDANKVSYYKLENTTDSWGANNLTNNNTVTFVAAKYNNGASMGTSNTNKSLSVASNLGISTGSVVFAGWVKILTAPALNTNSVIFALRTTLTSAFLGYQMFYNDVSGVKKLHFSRTRLGVADDFFEYSFDLGTNTLHHLILAYDGTNLVGYLDGASVGHVAASGSGSSGTDNFQIGADGASGQFSSSIVDDFPIFNRAFTDADALDLYVGASALKTLSFTESVATSDTISKFPSIFFADSLVTSDSITHALVKIVNFVDTIATSDTISKFISKALSDSVATSDSLSKLMQRAFSDTISTLDTITSLIANRVKMAVDVIVDKLRVGVSFVEKIIANRIDGR